MPTESGLFSRTTRCATSSRTVQSPHRVGASGPVSRARSQRRSRSARAKDVMRARIARPPEIRTAPFRPVAGGDGQEQDRSDGRAAEWRRYDGRRLRRTLGRHQARALDLRDLDDRQPALRRADRRRRLGARLVHRPRRAAGLPRRRDRRRDAVGGPRALPRRRDPARGRHRRPPARRRHHAVPDAGAHPPRGHPAVPLAPDGVAPAAPHRRAALQRQLRRRGRLGADRAAPDGGRHGRDDGDRGRPDAVRRPGRSPSSACSSSRW